MASVLFPIVFCSFAAAQGGSIDGLWQGALDVGGMKLRLALHVTKTDDGKLAGTLDSLDQGASGLPVASISRGGDTVKVDMKAIGCSYEGTLSKDASTMTGTFTQGGGVPLTLQRKKDEKKN